jgi:hypothetical protein
MSDIKGWCDNAGAGVSKRLTAAATTFCTSAAQICSARAAHFVDPPTEEELRAWSQLQLLASGLRMTQAGVPALQSKAQTTTSTDKRSAKRDALSKQAADGRDDEALQTLMKFRGNEKTKNSA